MDKNVLSQFSKSLLDSAKNYETPPMAVKAAVKKQMAMKIAGTACAAASGMTTGAANTLKTGAMAAKTIGAGGLVSTGIKATVLVVAGIFALGVANHKFSSTEKAKLPGAVHKETLAEQNLDSLSPKQDEAFVIDESNLKQSDDELSQVASGKEPIHVGSSAKQVSDAPQKRTPQKHKRRLQKTSSLVPSASKAKADLQADNPTIETSTAEKVSEGPRDLSGPLDQRGLEAERRLLSSAWNAQSFNRNKAALRLISKHNALFPDGVLAQEREGLKILITCQEAKSMGRKEAKAFLEKYPKTLLRTKIKKTCF